MKPSTMGSLSLSAAVAAATFFTSMAAYAEKPSYQNGDEISVDAFDSLVLTNGEITATYGEEYSVRIISGADTLKIEQDDGTLKIGCDRKLCPRSARHRVEVTTDLLENVVIAGGGRIEVRGNFPEVDEFNVVITGGGEIDAADVQGRDVSAVITGGGSITVSASDSLDAAIVGGGEILYYGDPEVSKSILGGGAIRKR